MTSAQLLFATAFTAAKDYTYYLEHTLFVVLLARINGTLVIVTHDAYEVNATVATRQHWAERTLSRGEWRDVMHLAKQTHPTPRVSVRIAPDARGRLSALSRSENAKHAVRAVRECRLIARRLQVEARVKRRDGTPVTLPYTNAAVDVVNLPGGYRVERANTRSARHHPRHPYSLLQFTARGLERVMTARTLKEAVVVSEQGSSVLLTAS